MWHDHPFSQRNKITERKVVMRFEGKREGCGGWTEFKKKGGGGRHYKRVFVKQEGQDPSANYDHCNHRDMALTLKF